MNGRPITVFGRHSFLAYMCIETTCRGILWTMSAVVIGGTDRRIGHGLTRFFDDAGARLLMDSTIILILCFILFFWDRRPRLNREN